MFLIKGWDEFLQAKSQKCKKYQIALRAVQQWNDRASAFPVSSLNSRIAACAGVSPASIYRPACPRYSEIFAWAT
jgi:hypothetical protein